MARRRIIVAAVVAVLLAGTLTGCQRAAPLVFRVTMPKAKRATRTDGRLLIVLSKDTSREPRMQISQNVTTQQVYGINVDGLDPDNIATLDATAVGYPIADLAALPAGEYNVQAVLNLYETFHRKDGHVIKAAMDQWEGQHWNTKPGNLYSTPRSMWIDPAKGGTIALTLDKEIKPFPPTKETRFVKYVRIESKLLSDFWGRKFELGAFVLLPDGFDDHPDAHYPIVINPAHFPTGLNAFSTEVPDPQRGVTKRSHRSTHTGSTRTGRVASCLGCW